MKNIPFDPFEMIGEKWALVAASQGDEHGAMTVSWGGAGVLWNKKVVTLYIRPTRHTYTLLEKTDLATISFFTDEYKKTLSYFGRVSGRDEDKIAVSGLSCSTERGAPIFEEASRTFVLKKLYYSDIDKNNFSDPALDSHYNGDYHRMYIYEIIDEI